MESYYKTQLRRMLLRAQLYTFWKRRHGSRNNSMSWHHKRFLHERGQSKTKERVFGDKQTA